MADTLTATEWHQVLWLLGPWVVGSFTDWMLQGILFCQFVNYFNWYRDDKPRIRILVAILALLTTLKSAQAFLIVWEQNIVHFASVEDAIMLSYTTWWQTGNGLMTATIGVYVQSYFCLRLYSITRKVLVVAPIAIIFTFAYVSSIVSTYYISIFDTAQIGHWFAAHLSSAFVGDTLLAGTTAYALLTATNKHALKQTNDLIAALVRLTWQTVTPAALCAMCNLIFSQIYNGETKLVSAAFNMALPKLYAISMMWTLNARRSIRIGHSSGNMSSSGDFAARSMGRSRRTGDVELGRLGTLQIRTEVETIHHIDEPHSDPTFRDAKHATNSVPSRHSYDVESDVASYKG